MKKLFFIAAFGLMSVAATQAQEIRLGAKGGVNFSNIGGDNNNNSYIRNNNGGRRDTCKTGHIFCEHIDMTGFITYFLDS